MIAGANWVVVATNGDGSVARPSSSSRIASSTQRHAETAVFLGDRQGRPVQLDHRVPPSAGVGAFVDHRADERGRALLVDDAADGVLQLALVVIEFEIHAGSIRLAVRVDVGVEQVEISLHPDENDNFTATGNLREDECRRRHRRRFKERDEQLWGSGTNRTC